MNNNGAKVLANLCTQKTYLYIFYLVLTSSKLCTQVLSYLCTCKIMGI